MDLQTTYARAELETDRSRPTLTWLYLDDYASSAIDEDPRYLAFGYMAHMRALIQSVFAPPTPMRALHLGGAGCALPRALVADHPSSRHLAVEYDPILAGAARTWFDLPRSPALRIRVGEGRQVLSTQAGKAWDVIVRDAFISGSVPGQLTTVEFVHLVEAALCDRGIYLANVAGRDHPDISAITAVFGHVLAVAQPAVFSGKRHGNVTVAASHHPWPAIDQAIARLPDMARVYRKLDGFTQPATDARLGIVSGRWDSPAPETDTSTG